MTGFELRAHRIAAINEVENLMARHIYYHAACMNQEELDDLWTKLQPDEAAFKQNFGWWISMDHIYPYYAPEAAKTRGENIRLELMEAKPELAERLKSIDGRRLSEMPTHVLSSSIIEIAEDGMSARGLWYTPGFAIRGFGEQLDISWMYEKYGADFVYEDGEWKFLHLLICMDIMGSGDTTDWANPSPKGPGGIDFSKIDFSNFNPGAGFPGGAPGGMPAGGPPAGFPGGAPGGAPAGGPPAGFPGGAPGGPAPAAPLSAAKSKEGASPAMGGIISQKSDAPGIFKNYSPTRLNVELPKIPRPYKTLGGEDQY